MTSPSLEAELLCRVGGDLLEGPSWDAAGARVLFVDIRRAERLACDWRTTDVVRIPVDETCSAWIPRRAGGSVVAGRTAVQLLDGTGVVEVAIPLEADRPANRSNDAKCDPRGRLWVGTMAEHTESPSGALYRIDRGIVTRVLADITISNGLGWSPDGGLMYHVDTPMRRIDVLDYDVNTGRAHGRRTFADVRRFDGLPDGLAVDGEGCLWVAFYGGSAVRRFSPDGGRLASIMVPAARPTSCAFVSDGLERLAITTAAAPDGTGGDLYVCDTGVPGLPVSAYDG